MKTLDFLVDLACSWTPVMSEMIMPAPYDTNMP